MPVVHEKWPWVKCIILSYMKEEVPYMIIIFVQITKVPHNEIPP
jgi:hypothetical protein